MSRNLTPKQRKFVTAYLQNAGNGRLAAAQAGYRGNDHTLRQIAYENLTKPVVRSALLPANQQGEDLRVQVLEEIRSLAFQSVEERPTTRNKLMALQLMAKATGILDDAPIQNVQVNVGVLREVRDMSEAELLAVLARSKSRASPVEVL